MLPIFETAKGRASHWLVFRPMESMAQRGMGSGASLLFGKTVRMAAQSLAEMGHRHGIRH
jgi:hypothetical protein